MEDDTIEFRLAAAGDVDVILGFSRELYALENSPFDERGARAALEGLLRDPSFGRAWMILDAGRAIGYLVVTFGYSLEYHGRDAYVDELFVEAGHRGRGAGTRALKLAEVVCRDLGVRALHLEVERSNTVAQRVYRRAGFEDNDRHLMTKWIAGS